MRGHNKTGQDRIRIEIEIRVGYGVVVVRIGLVSSLTCVAACVRQDGG